MCDYFFLSPLQRRNKLNEGQSITLQNQRLALSDRKDEMAAIDRRIEELTEELRNKRSIQHLHHAPPLIPNHNNNNVAVQNGPNQKPGLNHHMESNRVPASRHSDVKSLPNGDVVNSYAGSQRKQGPPAPPKPQLMMKPGFKPRSANKGSVSAPQGGPVAAQHPKQNGGGDQAKHNGINGTDPSGNKPETANENSGSDTSSLTENSSVESIPMSGLPPQPLPGVKVGENNKRSSPVQVRVSPVPQKGSSPVSSKSSSPIPHNHHRNSPVQIQRGSPIPQQLRGSPVPSTQRGSPVQRSSPIPHNPPRVLPGSINDPAKTTSLHNRQARNRTPIYNPDDLAMLSPPAPPSPNGSSNSSGSHFEIDDSIKSGHSNSAAAAAQKGRLPSYSGSTGNRNGRGVPDSPDLNRASANGPNQQHPPSPQRKRQPPPAPPRTSTLNYAPNHPPSPTRSGVPQRMSSTSSEPATSNGSMNNGRDASPLTVNGPPGSPSRGPPQSPTRGGLPRTGIPYSSYGNAPSGYGPNGSYPTAPPSGNNPNAPPRPQLPYNYNSGESDPTRPIHQRSPATVGMYAPPPNAQQRNYNHPRYQQNPAGPQSPRSYYPSAGYQGDDQDGPRPSSPTNNKLPIMNLYRNIDLERFHNMPRPLKKRLSYSEDKESLNFLKLGSPNDNKFDNLTLDKNHGPKNNSGHSGNEPSMPRIIETSLVGNNTFNVKNTLSPDVNTNTKPSNGKPIDITLPASKAKDNSQLSKPSGSGKPLKAADIGNVKGILKRKPNGREHIRVRFDPLALLLDASLEGEFELVQRIIPEVRL